MGITLEEIDLNASLPINPTIIRIMRVLRIARGTLTQSHTLILYMHVLHTQGVRGKNYRDLFCSAEATEDGHRDEITPGHGGPGFTAGWFHFIRSSFLASVLFAPQPLMLIPMSTSKSNFYSLTQPFILALDPYNLTPILVLFSLEPLIFQSATLTSLNH